MTKEELALVRREIRIMIRDAAVAQERYNVRMNFVMASLCVCAILAAWLLVNW